MPISRLTSWLGQAITGRKTSRPAATPPLNAERLEGREVPAIFTVTWTGSGARAAGDLSLQEAIVLANATPGADQINFATGITKVRVATTPDAGGPVPGLLPDITETLTIDGLAGSGGATKVTVDLASSAPGEVVSGFYFTTPAAVNSIVRGMTISDFGAPANFTAAPSEFGVKVDTVDGGFNLQNVTITGIDGPGVWIQDSKNNIIGGQGTAQSNIITKNNGEGVLITGAGSTGNIVQQSTITSNASHGIWITGGSNTNTVGGQTTSPADSANIIYFNNGEGVFLDGSSNNRVQRNFIGNDGTTNKANSGNGILIANGANNNQVGGNDLTTSNRISGNTENGVYILNSSGNQVQSNLIGLNPTTTNIAMPNGGSGVRVENSPNTKIGSTTTAANFIAGNNLHGVEVLGQASSGSQVVNNRIGIGGTSLAKLDTKVGNLQDGIFVQDVQNVTVGGGGTNAQNIIGGNRNGIAIVGLSNDNDSSNNVDTKTIFIRGNQLGVNKLADGTYPNIGNIQDGILIQDASTVMIGGTQLLEGNKAAGNRNGVRVNSSDNITLQGNFIGPNLTGTIITKIIGKVEDFEPAFQAEDGVRIDNSTNVKVGTATQGGGNLISHNRNGVRITNGSKFITIQNNLIGTQAATAITKHDLGNQDDGISIDNSSDILIGGTGPQNGNTLALNLDGIQITNGSKNITVQQNTIRNNQNVGVRSEGSSFITIGGAVAGAKNTIMNRRLAGIDTKFTSDGVLLSSGTNNVLVQGNYIGTDSTDIATNGLTGNGVLINDSFNNIVGMTTTAATLVADITAAANEGNIIARNSKNGVAVAGDTSINNKISGNQIYNNGLLGIDLDNTAGQVTPNDLFDADTGSNNRQNFPILINAQSSAGTGTKIQGTIESMPNHQYRIEFFHIDVPNPGGNPINHGQGKLYLGSTVVTTDGDGWASYLFSNNSVVLPAGQFISATATDITLVGGNPGPEYNDTSEMSLTQVIEGAPGPITYVINNDGNIFPDEGADLLIPGNGTMTLSKAITLANEHPGTDRIVFALHPQYTISSTTITYYQESRNLYTNGDLPAITDTLILDGSYQAWPQVQGGDKRFEQNYGIVFKGAGRGILISDNPTAQAKFTNPNAKADRVIIRNLTLSGANGVGVEINTNQNFGAGAGQHSTLWGGHNLENVTISGFNQDGIRVVNTPNNIIGGSGDGQTVNINGVSGSGINILGVRSTGNLIQQTNIGAPGAGTPGGNGIWIQGADNNTIGGFTTNTNVSIQGVGDNGIYILNSSGTRVQRSAVGDASNLLRNGNDGIRIENSPNTVIGGAAAGAGNVILASTENGINAYGAATINLQIFNNVVGSTAAPNGHNGILIDNIPDVKIGATTTGPNSVNGNNKHGILIRGANARGARITNTSVGNNGGNVLDGISIQGVSDVQIGSAATNGGGTISNNDRGVVITDYVDEITGAFISGSSKVTVQQYTISNHLQEGVLVENAPDVLIGGITSAAVGNTISGNRDGIRGAGSKTTLTIQGNKISGQSQDGVIIGRVDAAGVGFDGTGTLVVGSPFQFGGNTISNNRNGVRILNLLAGAKLTVENNTLNTNVDDAIRLDGIAGATIGGISPLSGNKALGNRNGLHLTNGTTGTTVLGNTFANGTENGISLEGSSNNVIGGDTIAERNYIFSNNKNGIQLGVDVTNPFGFIYSDNNVIQGNYIGVGVGGTTNSGNGNAGIYIDSGSNNLIGGKVRDLANKIDEGNLIGNSGAIVTGAGVAVVLDTGLLDPFAVGRGQGNSILGNGIFNSSGLGIDLNGNIGLVDDNDDFDGDVGANGSQNFPELTFAEVGLVSSVASGKLLSTPFGAFRIEFFGDTTGNATGYGEGKTFLGAIDVTDADGDGIIEFDFFAPVAFTAGGVVSATATDLATGDTSEFSEAIAVENAVGSISGVKFEDLDGDGIKDPGEPGLAGWVIELEVADANGVFDGKVDAKVITGAGGAYSFATLTDGLYRLSEVQKTGWRQTAAPVPNPVQITGGASLIDQDFGNFELTKVFGVKFEDKNSNAVRDPGEGPIAGVVINLLDASTNKVLATTTTDLSGNYSFTNLFPGDFGKTTLFRVREVVPAGYTQTTVDPPDFQIVSGVDVGPFDFGNFKSTGGGGGGATGGNIIVVGSGPGIGSVGLRTGSSVRVFSSAEAGKGISKQLLSFTPYGNTFRGGVRVDKGDVDGDGKIELITGPGYAAGATGKTQPLIKIFDGQTGLEIDSFLAFEATWTKGVHVGTGDVNGDGADDIIVGRDAGGLPEVRVFDGKTRFMIGSFMAYETTFRGGVRVEGGDVVAGDGFDDIVVAPGYSPILNGRRASVVRVFDGTTVGTPDVVMDREIKAYGGTFIRGLFVATGRLNDDEFDDVIITPDAGMRSADVLIYDGASGELIEPLSKIVASGQPSGGGQIFTDARWTTGVRVAVADTNSDGIDEIVTAPGASRTPFISIYDAKTGQKLAQSLLVFESRFRGGVYVG